MSYLQNRRSIVWPWSAGAPAQGGHQKPFFRTQCEQEKFSRRSAIQYFNFPTGCLSGQLVSSPSANEKLERPAGLTSPFCFHGFYMTWVTQRYYGQWMDGMCKSLDSCLCTAGDVCALSLAFLQTDRNTWWTHSILTQSTNTTLDPECQHSFIALTSTLCISFVFFRYWIMNRNFCRY